MRYLYICICIWMLPLHVHALLINEILSNPVGDDNGREWVEIYNDSDETIDIANLSLSIKGGAPVVVTPVSGGSTLPPRSYAIIGSIVSGATKFAIDYPTYAKPLFKASIGLVNTGVTSIELKQNGVTVDAIPSYTAAKEGMTYARVGATFSTGEPTPGEVNVIPTTTSDETASTRSDPQSTIPQAAPPSADIMLYLDVDKKVVAGAETAFETFGLTQAGKEIKNLTYVWSFGDGGSSTGSSTSYTYAYPGRYVAFVEATNGLVAGKGRISVTVYAPDIILGEYGTSRLGAYMQISNPNAYDLDISYWKMYIGGALYSFPKNTVLLKNQMTTISGKALGFASTTLNEGDVIKLLFPNGDEVTRRTIVSASTSSIQQPKPMHKTRSTLTSISAPSRSPVPVFPKNTSTTTLVSIRSQEVTQDKRLVRWFSSFWGK